MATKTQPPEPQNWEIVRQVFRHEDVSSPIDIMQGVLIIAGLVMVIILIAAIMRMIHHRRFASKPVQVFHRLADELGLALADQWLLIRISHRLTLPTPLTLLLSTATLRYHAERYAQTLSPRGRAKVMARVSAIDASLFGP